MYQIDFHKPLSIHFIGIGGISMSGLAEILLEEGFTISGSDSKKSPLTSLLESKGAKIYYGQRASNISDSVQVVVYTAAIHPDNPEFACAKEKGIPMLTRAQLLGQIMRNYDTSIAVAGTHGRSHDHRTARREIGRQQQVVGHARGHFGQRVGRSRGDQVAVGPLAQRHVRIPGSVLRVEELHEYRVLREGGHRERGDELFGERGHHDAHVGARRLQ